MSYLVLLFSSLSMSYAQIIAPSAKEASFRFSTDFTYQASEYSDYSLQEIAGEHARHMFGVFHSPKLIQKYGLNPELVGGIGAPRDTFRVTAKITTTGEDRAQGLTRVAYSAQGKMILHKKAATNLLAKGYLEIPLPKDLSDIYDKNCTDDHYESLGDFWYFWDPFRRGCEYLAKEKSNPVRITLVPAAQVKKEMSPRLDLLRGANGNGEILSIYVVHGFNESSSRNDEGRQNYDDFNDMLERQGFEQQKDRAEKIPSLKRQVLLFTKEMTFNGRPTLVEVRHLLTDTGAESRSTVFAKFFKKAVKEADVIIYAGHSGLGGNLDIPTLERKAGAFEFNPQKRQVFFFESCSSYSYYLEPFAAEKTKAKIDIVTNGLSSYFHTGPFVLEVFVTSILDETVKDTSWLEILRRMEAPLEGGSYLLNVGGF
jgi:hypothetical protein